MRTPNAAAVKALQRIAEQSGGVLLPSSVVDAARPKSSPLNPYFTWDNTRAARAYRIWQARQLISVSVSVIAGSDSEPERIWVSLKSDREEGGYRSLVTVLNDREMRAELLKDAMEDMTYFEEKYNRLNELAELFSAIKKVRKRIAG